MRSQRGGQGFAPPAPPNESGVDSRPRGGCLSLGLFHFKEHAKATGSWLVVPA